MEKKMPKFVKSVYKKKERLCVKVNKLEKYIVYGTVANNPITKGLKFNDIVKLKLSDVVDYIYCKYKQIGILRIKKYYQYYYFHVTKPDIQSGLLNNIQKKHAFNHVRR